MVDKRQQLADIVGAEYVFNDSETLGAYSRDHSFAPPRRPWFVVKPKSTDEVQRVVKWANETGTPLVPVSSGPPRFRGDTVPSVPGAVIVDLSRMKRILRIDRRNKVTVFEPGVTYSQLQAELAKEGLRLSMPLLPRSSKSVMASLLEREPTLVPRYQWQIPDPLRCMEVVWGNGDVFRTGEAGAYGPLEDQWKKHVAQLYPFGPEQTDYYRFVQAAQGSMGIATWVSARCEILPQVHKFFLVPSERLEALFDFAYRVLRLRYGDELFILNRANLASILGGEADQITALREELPHWVLILGVAGRDRLPVERVEFQEKDIRDIAQQFGVGLMSEVPGVKAGQILEILDRTSADTYWKLRYRGECQDIFFITTLNKTPEFINAIYSLSQTLGYSPSEMGVYIQPLMQGVACHCELSLPFDPGNQSAVARVQRLATQGSEALMNLGAFFSRPYGAWANMVYNRDAQSTRVLKIIKGIFDPNNVMNPGKLCF